MTKSGDIALHTAVDRYYLAVYLRVVGKLDIAQMYESAAYPYGGCGNHCYGDDI